MTQSPESRIVTVSLNPAIDRAIEVERLVPGDHLLGREITRTAGGKGVNVARALAALGTRCVATGFLGEDNREAFDACFTDADIADQFFPLSGRTRENITLVDRSDNTETHIRDVGLEVSQRDLDRLTSKLKLLSGEGTHVLFCGSTPPGVSAEAFAALVDACVETGAHVAVDTSGDALRAMRGRELWLLKPNAKELADLVGRELPEPAEQFAAAREVVGDVENVILTRGGEGASLFTRRLECHARVAVRAEDVQNTVGCGDVLLGVFVACRREGMDLRPSLARAVAAATASACHEATAKFDPQLVDELQEKVVIEGIPST
jgi:1-phosphofructokinase family hexose kinase